MEPEGSLPYEQEPATGPYPELVKSSPKLPCLFLWDIFIFFSHLWLDLSSGFFLSDYPTKMLYELPFSPIHAKVKPFSEPGYFAASWWRTPLRHSPKITIDQ
jgi:hypothetical protein